MAGSGPSTRAKQEEPEAAARGVRLSHELVGIGISKQGQPPASMPSDARDASEPPELAPGVRISQVQRSCTRSSSATSPCPRTHSVIACDTFSIISGDSISRTAVLPHRPGIGPVFIFISHPLYRIAPVTRSLKIEFLKDAFSALRVPAGQCPDGTAFTTDHQVRRESGRDRGQVRARDSRRRWDCHRRTPRIAS